jgi:hypothetical protein
MNNQITLDKCVFKSETLAQEFNENGFVLAGSIGKSLLNKVKNVYDELHNFPKSNIGVFHTLYSTDLIYRSKLNLALNSILKPTYDVLFTNYKVTANLVIVKFFREDSAFGIHQDTTGLDEDKFVPINVWIPLQDTAIDNGCLCIVPKSQNFAFPYRGTSFKGQFDDVTEEIIPFLLPIKMKAGDILIFDNRVLHYSPPNSSKMPRVVVMSGIFHKDADIITCFKNDNQSPIELYKQSDDYLLTYKGFKTEPPKADSGIKIKEVSIKNPISNKDEFLTITNKYQLNRYDAFSEFNKSKYQLKKQKFINRIIKKFKPF